MLLQIARTPSLSWLDKSFNLCAQEQNEYRIIALEATRGSILNQNTDISIFWGEPDPSIAVAYELGQDELVFIIHPDNPQQDISLKSLQKIYSGQEVVWQNDQAQNIVAWRYPENNEAQILLEKLLGDSAQIDSSVSTTADISGMLVQISQNPEAIGFIPKNLLQPGVKPIQIKDLPRKTTTYPIIAVLPTQPDNFQTYWLACLQEKIASDQ